MNNSKSDKVSNKDHSISMAQFNPYVANIESLVDELSGSSANVINNSEIQLVLDGQPMKVLRKVVPIADLKNSGAFFTNHDLSNQLVKPIIPDIQQGSIIGDPACGVGNLLLACARHLPILKYLKETLNIWGERLYGYDIHPEFIRATKARLVLLAIERGVKGELDDINSSHLFPNIRVSNYLIKPLEFQKVNCIVINPPYSMVKAVDTCKWSSGSISQAALFLEKCVMTATSQTKILAILPDVLRTGSRYLKWRNTISSSTTIESTEIVGQFDKLTDIDVFLLRMTIGHSPSGRINHKWWNFSGKLKLSKSVIADYYNVHVGPVVPYRDPHKGKWYPYIHARLLPSWTTINTDNDFKKRRFNRTVFKPPFVVIRRTSRPSDSNRAIASIIKGNSYVAVENHLIVCKPKSGHLNDCHNLLELLKSDFTNEWLNKRIRCRHLTVTAIRELPWRSINSE